MTAHPPGECGRVEPAPAAIDPEAWVEEHGDALFRYALGRLGRRDLAEDVVQETFLAALAAGGRFQGRSSARTWLVAILRRKVADRMRRGAESGPRKPAGPDVPAPSFFDVAGDWLRPPSRWEEPGRAIESEELRAALDDCLGRLPPHLAEPFLLRERDEMDVEQVRSALSLSAGNLRVRLHRARLLLRECLERNWFDA